MPSAGCFLFPTNKTTHYSSSPSIPDLLSLFQAIIVVDCRFGWVGRSASGSASLVTVVNATGAIAKLQIHSQLVKDVFDWGEGAEGGEMVAM